MRIIVLANASQKAELSASLTPGAGVTWIDDVQGLSNTVGADAVVDLLFANEEGRKALLRKARAGLMIVSSVTETLAGIGSGFVRINGWPTFLSSSVVEASAGSEEAKRMTEKIFAFFNKKMEWLPDAPGFVTARVVSTVINEAFIALDEGVSGKEEMNTAMQLGTAYPLGPFEWAEKIGLQKVVTLLNKLAETQPRYKPSEGLMRETNPV